MKRHIVDNPFVKPENQSWELSPPASLQRSISPPPTNRHRQEDEGKRAETQSSSTLIATPASIKNGKSDTAAVEAGEIQIDDHVSFFSVKLLAARRPEIKGQPRLAHDQWLELYRRNLNDRGHHFVIHQHDHPVAGTHYDLRLQCNATSSISFAIMYGLPGDPNSKRLNRNATETRVHNLWNHLLETASHETGTMLLWDTGEYTVLPYPASGARTANNETDTSTNSDSDSDPDPARAYEEPEPAKLHSAFQNRKIKLRLNGTRLPGNYTISLRLHPENDRVGQPEPPSFKRRRTNPSSSATARSRRAGPRARPQAQVDTTSDSSRSSSPDHPDPDSEDDAQKKPTRRLARTNSTVPSLHRTASPPTLTRVKSSIGRQMTDSNPANASTKATPDSLNNPSSTLQGGILHGNNHDDKNTKSSAKSNKVQQSVDVDQDEDAQIRRNNAYPGATNSINSIHQRRWFLSLDRAASGFQPTNEMAFGRRIWERFPIGTRILGDATSTTQGRPRNAQSSTSMPTSMLANGESLPLAGFEPFYVLGRDVETSIVTGRTAADVARDEGLVGYRPRGGWRPVTD
ncbi:hypothetical protein A1O1_00920 [Capronia coronata CBS 617.96]|uniref:DNA ligase D 3'-phosphoesterase domain-containing protein n=1 Tax=Capronia coronata CBS 617.96 TaxID=1182541 RepID=W9Z2J4_9EURO|nr:uncharacterized protein A1O1_00920 [Capronia coronata CBS 617.96]EXJ95796.1 hypothetical protein A1O1_00920 [Capronia coronata CBS 617.96]